MSTETNAPHSKHCVKLPDELWNALLRHVPSVARGIILTVRLFNGQLVEALLLSSRGYLLGRVLSGPSQIDGMIDSAPLTFSTQDIEAVQIPAFRFWQRPKWIALNPQHPARRISQERAKQ